MIDLERTDYEFRRKIKKLPIKEKLVLFEQASERLSKLDRV